MRGRRGRSSSSVSQTRMPLRKQVMKDASDISSGNQQTDENTQEDEALDDRDDNEELSSSLLSPLLLREKRRRERENKSKHKEMTEDEMMDLALRLSEQEASITALRHQKEDEAVMKAIQESMVGQTQPCRQSQSQSLLAGAEASLRVCSRRKLLYSNGKSVIDQTALEDETHLNQGAERSADDRKRNKKRKRKEGSPLLEMPDLSQTQKVESQVSPCGSETLDLHLDSPQSSDSTQIDDCQLRKSPIFPLTGCRAEVQVPRLSQDLLQTCRTSGFVRCSQDSSPQKSLSARPKSPTFPRSPSNLSLSKSTTPPKSPVYSGTDQADDGDASPEYLKSPVFGGNPQQVCNSGFTLSSQESLTFSVRPRSPVFPTSPPPQRSPVFSETDGGQTEQSHRTSPTFGRTGRRQKIRERPAEITGSTSQSGWKNSETDQPDPHPDVRLQESSQSDEELKETSRERDSDGAELTSNMTLLWSDEDDDVTPVGSPSPVFPEERPVHQADGRPASLNHMTAASAETTASDCRPSSSSTSTSRQQQPISSQGAVSRASAPPGEPAGRSKVYYYWGVPFCPRGLDPDDYSQVILAQMEVYEKSLKQAQRCLLRKAEWGEAILPQPEKSPPSSPSPAESPQQLPRRRGLRLRSKTLCDTADTPPAEAEEEEDKREEEEEGQSREEEKKDEGQVDSDDCEVCPETQLSDNDDDRTQVLTVDTDTGAELPPKSPELPEVEMIVQVDSPAEDELQEEEAEMEVDAPVDRQTKKNIPVESSDVGAQQKEEAKEDSGDPDVEEVKDRGLQRSTSPELEPAVVPQVTETSVDCPICQGSFPVTEIEMHAAYCDGEEAAATHQRRPKADLSLKPRRKRTRRAEATAEETNDLSNASRNPEKCFICQKAVPLRDYSRHTELCIQRQTSRSAAKENLLSALEKTESRDSEAGPSGSKPQSSDVINLLDDDDEEEEEEDGSFSAIRISNSPIRAFTPISEATDCLIDFKKQHRSKKLSQRRR